MEQNPQQDNLAVQQPNRQRLIPNNEKEISTGDDLLTNLSSGKKILSAIKLLFIKAFPSVLQKDAFETVAKQNLKSSSTELLTDKELKSIQKQSKDSTSRTSAIKDQLSNNATYAETVKLNSKVLPIIEIKANTNVKIGFDSNKHLLISNSKNHNVDVWRPINKDELRFFTKQTESQLKGISISSDLAMFSNNRNFKHIERDIDVVIAKIRELNPHIEKQFNKLNLETLTKNELAKGHLISLDQSIAGDKNFKILKADSKEIHLQSIYNTNKAPVILNIEREKDKIFQKETIAVSKLDNNHHLGYDKNASKLTLGKVDKHGTIVWQPFEHGIKSLGETNLKTADKLTKLVKSGDYMLSNTIKNIQTSDGISIKVGQNNNGKLKYSIDGKNWKTPTKEQGNDIKNTMSQNKEMKSERTLKIAR